MELSKITIVGAGLGGSILGIYLSRRGYEVHLFELRGDLRYEPVEVGRSIKLTLAERGLTALRQLGLEEEVKSTITVPLRGRAVHSGKGTIVYQPYGKNDQEVIYSPSATLFMAVLAAFQSVLTLHTGRYDLVAGSNVANRNRLETEWLIGGFINILVLRTDLSGDPTFEERSSPRYACA